MNNTTDVILDSLFYDKYFLSEFYDRDASMFMVAYTIIKDELDSQIY